MASIVKVTYGGVMKRLSYGEEGPATLDNLVKQLKESFSIPERTTLQILYKDQDGDQVLLNDENDFNDAVKLQKLNPLYLVLRVISDESTKTDNKPATGGFTSDPLAEFFANWTTGEGQEHIRKFLPQGQDAFRSVQSILKTLDPAVSASGSDIMEKVLAGVSAAAAAASAATSAAATAASKAKEDASKEEPKPAAEKDVKTEDKTAEKTPVKEDPSEKTNQSVHSGVQCDVCNMHPIKGTRYKSMEQHDYDLCQTCMDAYPKKDEQFTRIEHPLYRPRHHGSGFRGGPRCGPGGFQFGGRPFNPPGCGNGPHHGPFNPARCGNGPSRWGGHGFRNWGVPNNDEAKSDARFVKDVTVYDGTEMVPGTAFTKIWRFRNTGTTAWPQGTKIVYVGGDQLSEQDSFELQISETGLAPGEEVDVAASLTAPEKPGRYVTHFRLATPQGVKYGHRMWALIHVLDQDEESPLVADSKASEESVQPSAPAVEEPEDEPVLEKEVSDDDVKVIPVEGEENVTEEIVEVTAPVVVAPESPKTERTNLGDDEFVKVEQADTKSADGSALQETVTQAPLPAITEKTAAVETPEVVDTASSEKILSATELAPAEAAIPVNEDSNKAPEGELYKEQLSKLAELGFSDAAQNVQLLEKYEGDLPKTINDLVTVNEWDPMMQELEEMGFYDKELNRSLIYKNNGRLQRVVKDLVQIYKAGTRA